MNDSTYFSLAHHVETLAREIRAYHEPRLFQGAGSYSPLVRDASFSMTRAAADQLREGRLPEYPAVAMFAEALDATPDPWGENALLWVGKIRAIAKTAVDLCSCFESINEHSVDQPTRHPAAIEALVERAGNLSSRLCRLLTPLLETCYGPGAELFTPT